MANGCRVNGCEVIERKQSEFVGSLQMNKGFAFFVADSDKKMPDIYIPEKSFNGANDEDRVVVQDYRMGARKG